MIEYREQDIPMAETPEWRRWLTLLLTAGLWLIPFVVLSGIMGAVTGLVFFPGPLGLLLMPWAAIFCDLFGGTLCAETAAARMRDDPGVSGCGGAAESAGGGVCAGGGGGGKREAAGEA